MALIYNSTLHQTGMRYSGWALAEAGVHHHVVGNSLDVFMTRELEWYDQQIVIGMPHNMTAQALLEHVRQFLRHYAATREVTDVPACMLFCFDVLRWHMSDSYMVNFDEVYPT